MCTKKSLTSKTARLMNMCSSFLARKQSASRTSVHESILFTPRSSRERRIIARNDARKAKDFKESDRIRDELAKMGVVLKDSKDGTTWEVAR